MSLYQAGHGPPESAWQLVNRYNVADRGAVVAQVRQQIRHQLPAMARTVVETTVAIVLVRLAHRNMGHLHEDVQGSVRTGMVLLLLAVCMRAGARIAAAVGRARHYRVTFHERGFELTTGILRCRRQFMWYFQLLNEPTYVRTPASFLSHTASIQLTYEDAGRPRRLELSGVGSPHQAEQLRGYLESRRLAERAPVRRLLT